MNINKQASPVIMILVSFVFLAVSMFIGIRNYNFVNSAVKTEARIKSIDKGKRRITPTYEFKAGDKTYEFEGASSDYGEFKIGDRQVVYYNPDDPNDSKVGTFMDLWFLPVFCGGFFAVFFSLGCIFTITKIFGNRRTQYLA